MTTKSNDKKNEKSDDKTDSQEILAIFNSDKKDYDYRIISTESSLWTGVVYNDYIMFECDRVNIARKIDGKIVNFMTIVCDFVLWDHDHDPIYYNDGNDDIYQVGCVSFHSDNAYIYLNKIYNSPNKHKTKYGSAE
jgi:hypothetical protein